MDRLNRNNRILAQRARCVYQVQRFTIFDHAAIASYEKRRNGHKRIYRNYKKSYPKSKVDLHFKNAPARYAHFKLSGFYGVSPKKETLFRQMKQGFSYIICYGHKSSAIRHEERLQQKTSACSSIQYKSCRHILRRCQPTAL